jgi:maltooligosyltrehalose trehalohydrolase
VATLTRAHHMPFGAEPLADGRIRFRLWAPAARRVELYLYRGTTGTTDSSDVVMRTLPMRARSGGWFCLATRHAFVGSRYRFRIDGDCLVPDPASRFQPQDVHGPSEVISPHAWAWRDGDWRGRPWSEAVIYELHVGAFSASGTFGGVERKLDYLAGIGITALEIMPVGDFPGRRSWGYDGAYLFAPDSRYGRPEQLKALIDAAHQRGLMVFLDVVYNHFGPEGNYLHLYAPQFFSQRHRTPWGASLNFDGEHSSQVRRFFIHNALYWLEEFHLDGLRLDAVHAIRDDSRPDIITQLSRHVHRHVAGRRHVHLILENDNNAAHYLHRDAHNRPLAYTAQWSDDIHHALHVLLTGEHHGYYMDYADAPMRHLCRCLGEGFAFQGEPSAYRQGRKRGEPSDHLPSAAFVTFLQNHDQVGNRAFGERITELASPDKVHSALALQLLAPSPPLIFMGQEWGSRQPFLFFCDLGPDFSAAVVSGRREGFAHFPGFRDETSRARIPDPMQVQTFDQSRLDWQACRQTASRWWLDLHRHLLDLRRREISPRLHKAMTRPIAITQLGERGLCGRWTLDDASELSVMTNLGQNTLGIGSWPKGRLLYATHEKLAAPPGDRLMPPWSVAWFLRSAGEP